MGNEKEKQDIEARGARDRVRSFAAFVKRLTHV